MAIDLPTAVLAFITALESVSGMPIAILERKDKTEQFWARTAAILCEKTKQGWCEEHVRFMTSNTEPLGQSQIMEYDFDGKGTKKVCAIIPPIANVDAWSISQAFGAPMLNIDALPSSIESASWLMLYHAAHCLDTKFDDVEEKRAKAVATLAVSLLGGNYAFTAGRIRSPARNLAIMSGEDAAWWAAGTGERILFDLWKKEASYKLQSTYNCYAVTTTASTIDTESIKRATSIPAGQNCAMQPGNPSGLPIKQGNNPQAVVSDENLYLWMFGPEVVGSQPYAGSTTWPKVGAPPESYYPLKSFRTMEEGVSYIIQTSDALAR